MNNLMIRAIIILFVTGATGGAGAYSAEGGARAIFLPDGGNILIFSSGGSFAIANRSKFLNSEILNNIAKLSSGLRIAGPADDPSGFAVAEKMKALILELRRKAMNDEDMRNYLNYVESALAHDTAVLARIRALALQASNGILGTDDRALLQAEVAELLDEVDANASYSEFNKKKVIPELTALQLGIRDIDVAADPQRAIQVADNASASLLKMRALAGTSSNILEFRIKGRNYYFVNLQAAESGIRDLDMAEEISALMKNYTLIKCEYGLILTGPASR
jgi:flagellin